MRLLVCGSRNLDATHAADVMRWLKKAQRPGLVLIHGDGPPGTAPGAIGADKLAEVAATLAWWGQPFTIERFRADWSTHGDCHCRPGARSCPAAGPRRNQRMVDEGKPEGWLAFPLKGQRNAGTNDMVARLKEAGVPGKVVLLP